MKYDNNLSGYMRVDFGPGHYTGNTLVTRLNDILKKIGMSSKFNYEEDSNRIHLGLYPDEGIRLPKRLAMLIGWQTETSFTYTYEESESSPNILGPENPDIGIFPDTRYSGEEDNEGTRTILPQHIHPENCMDLNLNTHHLYIYCNLVNEIMVGDIFAKLLRTVSTRSEDYGQYVTRTFTAPHYLPLASSFENYVEISIRDDNGQLIPFESGKVIVTLHFRKRK